MTTREELIADTFVELADTLVAEFDRGVDARDPSGGTFELQNHEGPCLEAFRTGEAVTRSDLAEMRSSWPFFTSRLEQAGFASAQAVPMRLREEVIRALNVFRTAPGPSSSADMRLARPLADVATVGLLQERTIRARERLTEQLQGALDSRVLIEQAKGVLAERSGLEVDQAFAAMPSHARRSGSSLRKVAGDIVQGRIRRPRGNGPQGDRLTSTWRGGDHRDAA
jgi:hypothetical protein